MRLCVSALLITFALGLILAGCSSYPQRFRYTNLPPNLKIIYASPESVDRHCARDVARYDDGNLADGSRRIRCCYYPKKHLIYVGRGEDSCLAHELKHFESAPDADKYHVRDQ